MSLEKVGTPRLEPSSLQPSTCSATLLHISDIRHCLSSRWVCFMNTLQGASCTCTIPIRL
ncbi:hypothetical protein CPB84DRAFT_1781488, partial [Gymnopilus junonius]